jgi:hypothetical protein
MHAGAPTHHVLPAILPTDAIETARIHSVACLTDDRMAFVTMRTCRIPTILFQMWA